MTDPKKPQTEFQLSYLPSEPKEPIPFEKMKTLDPESDEFQEAYADALAFVEADDITPWLEEE